MDLTSLKAERAKKLTWDVKRESWEESIVVVKIEEQVFAEGAQRACYRAKQLSGAQYSTLPDWRKVYSHREALPSG